MMMMMVMTAAAAAAAMTGFVFNFSLVAAFSSWWVFFIYPTNNPIRKDSYTIF